MKRTLVTGASGLLGSEIMKELLESIGLTSKDCNLTDRIKLRLCPNGRFDTVIHCAARVGGVIANSSFSWWGARLSESKMVVTPERWFGPNGPKKWNDVYCKGWKIV